MKDSVAIVTGGAGHIGKEIAGRLAEKGVNIAIVDKNSEAGNKCVEEIKSKHGVDALFVEADLLQESAFADVATAVEKYFGRADMLVNNAAFYDDAPGWGVPFEDEGYDAWLKVLRVNLLAPFFMVQKLAPLLKKSGSGSVVNISSIYGVVAPDFGIYEGLDMTNPAAYAASKGGMIQLAKWLSTALAPEVRVNTVTPGGVERGQDKTFLERYEAKTPLGRMAKETDIAGVVAFLCSPDAAYITGQNIIVDGGWTVW